MVNTVNVEDVELTTREYMGINGINQILRNPNL